MRHKVFGRKLSRNKKLRERLFRALVINFLIKGKMVTTAAKAKAVRGEIEKIVTRAKKPGNFARRVLYQKLNHKEAVNKALEAGKFFQEQKGGYLKLLKMVNRTGDNSEQILIIWSKEMEVPKEVKTPEVKKDNQKEKEEDKKAKQVELKK